MAFISSYGMIIESTPSSRNRAGRNINNLRYADYTTLMGESKEKLKNLLMRVSLWLTSHFDAINTQLSSEGVASYQDLDAGISVTALSG